MLKRISNVMLIITVSLFIIPVFWTGSLSEIGVPFWLWGIVLSYLAWFVLLMLHRASNPKESNGLSSLVGFLILLVMFTSATTILQMGAAAFFILLILAIATGKIPGERLHQQNNYSTNG